MFYVDKKIIRELEIQKQTKEMWKIKSMPDADEKLKQIKETR